MAKLGDVTIQIVPGAGETIEPVTLIRKDKIWHAKKEDGTIRGLYPGEIEIAHLFQKNVAER